MVLLGYRSLPEPRTTGVPRPSPKRKERAVVFGSKRDSKSDALSREDVVGNLYPDSLTSEVDVTPSQTEFRRSEAGNESVIDPHARFNGKYVSDRDLRIEGEAQGEIECQGTLIISPQARVRSAITAHNVIINGDYEGDVDCGGRFEIGSTGRVKGQVKTQVLVVKEGAHWEGSVIMTHEAARPMPAPSQPSSSKPQAPQPVAAGTPSGQGSIFSKQDRDAAPSGERAATGPGTDNGQ
jgi:cytoskeletal protein CcmA (bactofilin family)